MRYLNGFVVIGLMLLGISVAGMVRGNALLTEPGQPVEWFMWPLYVAAGVLMLINGYVSIRIAQNTHEAETAVKQNDEGAATGKSTENPR